MQRHFQEEIEQLKTTIIRMGSLAETAISQSLKSIIEHDAELAEQVTSGDRRINALEMEVDNAIIDLLALQQPVASDLRLILAAQKINNDLERIGDHAVNLAESAIALARHPAQTSYMHIPEMAEIAKTMLREALDGFIHRNAELGQKVLVTDDTIDDLNREMAKEVIERIRTNSQDLEVGLELIRISRNLERVADLATNIAEEVIFICNAQMVKHHSGSH